MTDKLTKGAVERLSQQLGEPGWLAERRLVAFDLYEKLELPDPKGEEWRYVDVRRFDFDRFSAPQPRRSAPELPTELASKGVVVADFVTAATEHADLMKEHFFTEVPVDEHKFTAAHQKCPPRNRLVPSFCGPIPIACVRRAGPDASSRSLVIGALRASIESIPRTGSPARSKTASHTPSRAQTTFTHQCMP